ncbi:RidA family protein [Nereida sp. MMG025]|uniref:RidA family protein n=1 Tax=Nereida sp. MMG025 TaxID=2909981 RepID=UPI001F1D8F6F|nr:RidA family protein [Nereida sp. MMG025]MCF6444713.1 RidA family protein [Nereida sp. MMG025]
MPIERHHPSERASKIVIHNGTVYLSGQVPNDVSASIQDQTRDTLAKVDALLQEAGSSRDHMLQVTIFLRDMKDFAAMNEVWNDWVADVGKPVRACVNAEMARREILIEVCVVAALKDS